MKRWLPVLCIALLVLSVGARAESSSRAPLVLAFYYNWYDENIWKSGQIADMPVQRYTSRDPNTMARQIQQARGAGIDAFVVSWWGAGNPTDDNLRILLDQAKAAGFQIAVNFEVTAPFYRTRDDVVNSLKRLLSSHVNHPAYLKVAGKPVVFFWKQTRYPVSTWQSIRDAVDAQRRSLWISEGVDTSYLKVFDGHHLYSIGWSQNPAADLLKYAQRVRGYGGDKIWVATTMPGNDDTRTGRKGAYVRNRRGGEFYRDTWRGALFSMPDWVIVNSFNEWVEQTMIEPSVTYGDLYLNITREYAAQFKGGAIVAQAKVAEVPTATPTRTQTPAAVTLIPGGLRGTVTDLVRVRAGPSTSTEILGRLREGSAVVLLGKSADAKWWQIAYPDTKGRGWISAEFTTTAISPTATPTPTVMPSATAMNPGPAIIFSLEAAAPGGPIEEAPISGSGAEATEVTLATSTPEPNLPWIAAILGFFR